MAQPDERHVKVRCEDCGKYSVIMAPHDEHPQDIIWKCPQQTGEGGDMCGAINTGKK
jgi:ribosomal protein S27E